jgi:drug/metabolite transporter (DMT)-like permease
MWAAQYAAYKTVTASMGPVTASTWTFLLASLVLLPFLLRERRIRSSGCRAAERSLRNRHNVVGFLMIGVLGLIPASAFLAWGTDRSNASNAALIYLTVPIITALLALAILGERMSGLQWISLVISLAGVFVLSEFDWKRMDLANTRFLAGNILVLLACSSSAFYNVYSKEMLRRFTPYELLVYGYWIAVVLSLPLAYWVEGFTWASVSAYTTATWFSLGVLSLMSWGIAMVIWMHLLQRLKVSRASFSIYLLPFLGVLIAALTLGEKLTGTMIAGGLVTLVGTVLATSSEASRHASEKEDM